MILLRYRESSEPVASARLDFELGLTESRLQHHEVHCSICERCMQCFGETPCARLVGGKDHLVLLPVYRLNSFPNCDKVTNETR